jgi:predicted acylesterase/phospholipase RssA
MLKMFKGSPKLAISMRGGFIRTAGYLGLLRAFEEAGIEISIFCASSMGAVIAAAYSSGISIQDITDLAKHKLHLHDIINFQSLTHLTLTTHEVMHTKLNEVFGDTKIEDLPHKLIIQVTDLDTLDEAFLEKGSLVDSLAASCSFPFVTLPMEINGKKYIDGDLTATFATNRLRSMGADIVVGLSPGKQSLGFTHHTIPERIADMITIPMRKIRSLDNQYEPLDLLITDLGMSVFQLDFEKIDELIEYGYTMGKTYVPQVNALLENKSNFKFKDILKNLSS